MNGEGIVMLRMLMIKIEMKIVRKVNAVVFEADSRLLCLLTILEYSNMTVLAIHET